MIIVLDSETNGLPKDYKAPLSDLDNWPRLVQLSWAAFLPGGGEVAWSDWIIRPDGFIIPEASSSIHGITHQRAVDEGLPLHAVLSELSKFIQSELYGVNVLVGHNLEYDVNVTMVEYMRLGMTPPFDSLVWVDTMKGTTEFCKLPGKYGYKWPKLSELYFKLFGETFEGGHNSLNDVRATARCFFELIRLGVIHDIHSPAGERIDIGKEE